ncbi:MAG: putative manganese transporter [Kiritimatiellae bacterium]|nr:putative manganese transporter [Kiritimatiellia bacterium]MDD5520920.1 putative manganese transporter [Kiritimatiellia bacterium]
MHIHESHGIIGVIGDAAMITGFVFVIMLVVEYFNVLTSGTFQRTLSRNRWGQYVAGVALGAIPGCLGGFAVASMYSHGIISVGAVIAAMISTTGDESFVMLATFPKKALLITLFLMVLGIITGFLSDILFRRWLTGEPVCDQKFEVHSEACECFATGRIFSQWKKCSVARGVLWTVLSVFIIAVILGQWETDKWDWTRITLLVLGIIALFIVSTVPDHFLEKHLWAHVARKHVPKIFAWTLGALMVMYFITGPLEKESFHNGIAGYNARWVALVLACVVGLIPESGPHLIFVFAYAHGAIPFGVLLANCVVQDGHGMLPILADSRRVFIGIKTLKFVLGFIIGGITLLIKL